jgi:hypothetical protein
MAGSRSERLAPLAGLVFIALAIASGILSGSTPDANDTTVGVAGFWKVHDNKEIVSALLGGVGVVFFLWFLGSLWATLRRAEPEPGRVSATVFGGFLVFAVGILSVLAFQFAAADVADDSGVAPQVVQTLSVLQSDFFLPLSGGLIVGMLASAVAILRFRAFPRWLGGVALISGILFFTPGFFIGLILAGLWVIAMSILMFRTGGAPIAREAA